MPIVLIVLGVLFLIVAIRGTQNDLFALLKSEFTGANSFVPWILAIVILGMIGYIKTVRPISNGLMGLVFLVMVLKNGTGFFDQLIRAVKNPVAPTQAANTAANSPATLAPASPAVSPALAAPPALPALNPPT